MFDALLNILGLAALMAVGGTVFVAVAMFVAAGLAANDPERPKHFAEYAYVLAAELMQERKNWIGDTDE